MKSIIIKLLAITISAALISGCEYSLSSIERRSFVESAEQSEEPREENADAPQEPAAAPAETTTATPATTTTKATTATTTATTTKATTTKAATTKATTTTAKTQEEPVEAKPVPEVDGINARTILKYEYGVNNFKLTGKNYILYDFSNKKDSGIGRDGTANPARMCYGVTAEVKDNKIYFATYNDYPDVCKVSVTEMSLMSDTKITSLNISDNTQVLDCSNLENGMYLLYATFSNNKKPSIAFYVNEGKVYLCSTERMTAYDLKRFQERRDLIQSLMLEYGVTPENSVSTENLCYPWNDQKGHNSDTPKWRALSNEITESDWSDGRKLFAFHEWMCENLAYDYYKSNVLIAPRAEYYKVFDGTYDTYQTRIGVCFDFTNILATMCREQNIPCITLDVRGHTWDMVYVNNVWIEIDMTVDIKNAVYDEDMTKWNRPSSPYCYNGFYSEFVNTKTPIRINDCLWDYDILYYRRSTIATEKP